MPVQSIARFEPLMDADAYARYLEAVSGAVTRLAGRVIWQVNSTARGGGVAEMMGPLVGCARGAGVDARWLVIAGTPEFFRITKRLHNLLHEDVETHRLQRFLVVARAVKFPQPRHDVRDVLARGANVFEIFLAAGIEAEIPVHDHVGKSDHGRKGVVDVVRNAAGHLAECLEPFLL